MSRSVGLIRSLRSLVRPVSGNSTDDRHRARLGSGIRVENQRQVTPRVCVAPGALGSIANRAGRHADRLPEQTRAGGRGVAGGRRSTPAVRCSASGSIDPATAKPLAPVATFSSSSVPASGAWRRPTLQILLQGRGMIGSTWGGLRGSLVWTIPLGEVRPQIDVRGILEHPPETHSESALTLSHEGGEVPASSDLRRGCLHGGGDPVRGFPPRGAVP